MNLKKGFSAAFLVIGSALFFAGCSARDSSAHAANEKNVLTLTKENFQAQVLSSTQPVLVDFWASWCGPCRMIAPTVAELATEFEGRAKVGKVDVDAHPDLAKEYNITGIPALMIFKDGKVAEQFVGVRSKKELADALSKVAPAAAPQSTTVNP